ncbi:MAG TPA: nucleotidyltransferase family protein [Alphaproteobacteria bacterium]|nr:nucleotidyltransferase family protein [Alphaproteobacteria bacterium]
MINKAFILGAGLGTRMRPLTDNIPKPMVEVGEESLIRRALWQLSDHGVTDITINTHYKAEELRAHLADHANINWSHEDILLNTGGGIAKTLPHFKEQDFFVIAGDSYWIDAPAQTALSRLQEHWNPAAMDILLLLEPVSRMRLTTGVGDYDFTAGVGFGPIRRSLAQTGTHMFTSLRINTARIFDDCPPGPFSYLDLMDKAESQGRLFGLEHDGIWHHLSTPQDVAAVNKALKG